MPYARLDEDSFAAYALKRDTESRQYDVLACDVGGACTVVSTDLPNSVSWSVGSRGTVS
ncbi:hypothetical protein [Nocardioides sp. B-3]|uniref:hypothetical protein n=1 Tax=Nocardioides sp. B-3 TaxID=2895565 RepID=UPI0021523DA4|nr:hypothetical protein [Nocardioides sp. B-3]UUZ58941.1 hypothetical protein LP418_23315 [Nocardioides sp. B-3]